MRDTLWDAFTDAVDQGDLGEARRLYSIFARTRGTRRADARLFQVLHEVPVERLERLLDAHDDVGGAVLAFDRFDRARLA